MNNGAFVFLQYGLVALFLAAIAGGIYGAYFYIYRRGDLELRIMRGERVHRANLTQTQEIYEFKVLIEDRERQRRAQILDGADKTGEKYDPETLKSALKRVDPRHSESSRY